MSRDAERERALRRVLFEARLRGLFDQLAWIFGAGTVVVTVGMLFQTWRLGTENIAEPQAAMLRFQTRNGFIAAAVLLALFGFVSIGRRAWEARVAARRVSADVALQGARTVEFVERLRMTVILWVIRSAWPLLAGLALIGPWLSPPMKSADRNLLGLIGAAMFVVWFFVARTRGPASLNRDARLERGTTISA